MEKWIDVLAYRDFWDQPRIFFVRVEGNLILFDCAFDEEIEDYPDDYLIYRMPEMTESEWEGSWAGIARRANEQLGVIPLSNVRFDDTRRKQIDSGVLQPFVERLKPMAV